MYHSSVFAFLEKLDPVTDRVTGVRAYRISVVSDDGLPDAIEFAPPRDLGSVARLWSSRGRPLRVKIDLAMIRAYFVCDEEELNDGFTRYTFILAEAALELPGAVSFVPTEGERGD